MGCNKKNRVVETTSLTVSCVDCIGGLKTLDAFCVDNCNTYSIAIAGCNGLNALDGSCNKPIEDNGICVTTV